jgi:hypothetical protein
VGQIETDRQPRRQSAALQQFPTRVLRKWLYIKYRELRSVKPFLVRKDWWSLEVDTLDRPNEAGGGFEYFGLGMTRLKNRPT